MQWGLDPVFLGNVRLCGSERRKKQNALPQDFFVYSYDKKEHHARVWCAIRCLDYGTVDPVELRRPDAMWIRRELELTAGNISVMTLQVLSKCECYLSSKLTSWTPIAHPKPGPEILAVQTALRIFSPKVRMLRTPASVGLALHNGLFNFTLVSDMLLRQAGLSPRAAITPLPPLDPSFVAPGITSESGVVAVGRSGRGHGLKLEHMFTVTYCFPLKYFSTIILD